VYFAISSTGIPSVFIWRAVLNIFSLAFSDSALAFSVSALAFSVSALASAMAFSAFILFREMSAGLWSGLTDKKGCSAVTGRKVL
jgi:hypothetical protein